MKKILVVDDEFLIRYTLEEGLKDRGYDAKSAGTIEEAVECVKKFHPNVVILDNLLEHSVGMDEIATFKNMDEDIQVIFDDGLRLRIPGSGGDQKRGLRLCSETV